MVDTQREKYLKLMIDIDNIEQELEACKAYGASIAEIRDLAEVLIKKSNELQRVSDGCGKNNRVWG